MIDKISSLKKEIDSLTISSFEDLEQFRLHYLSKKGVINQLFKDFKTISSADKKKIGSLLNQLKQSVSEKYNHFNKILSNASSTHDSIDLSSSSESMNTGSRHPVSITHNRIVDIFSRLGFTISSGPEIEDDWHVFSALNFPEEHPARDMQDTFFIQKNPDILLRTHTSSIQVRVMETTQPPIRTISPGRVFRNEAISARSHCIFHQIEGLYIDESVSFSDLKQSLLFFAKELFGSHTNIRLRPSFFPFTEPSAEMDITCTICKGKGCPMCKYSGWVEILGCGMVDPNVLENLSINPDKYTGFAFGMGLERIAILLHQIKDIRLLFENDIRFLHQFHSFFC
jgi:phenylalanyl-tRNA synthetase alpha chain